MIGNLHWRIGKLGRMVGNYTGGLEKWVEVRFFLFLKNKIEKKNKIKKIEFHFSSQIFWTKKLKNSNFDF